MKFKIILILIFFNFSFAESMTVVESIASLNKQNFGSPSSLLLNKTITSDLISKGKTVKCYSSSKDKLEIQKTKLHSINYCYFDDKLFNINYLLKNGESFENIKNDIQNKTLKTFFKNPNNENDLIIIEFDNKILRYVVSIRKQSVENILYDTISFSDLSIIN